MISEGLVVPITVALVAETPRITHLISMLTCSGARFSAIETIAFLAHALGIMWEVVVDTIFYFFLNPRLSLALVIQAQDHLIDDNIIGLFSILKPIRSHLIFGRNQLLPRDHQIFLSLLTIWFALHLVFCLNLLNCLQKGAIFE